MGVLNVDIAIVGASLAGSACALALTRNGATVAIIDKADFPRRKPCGAGLSLRGWRALEELGCGTVLATIPSCPFSYFDVLINGKHSKFGNPHLDFPLGIGISRELLDAAILSCVAKLPNVNVLTGTAPRRVRHASPGFEVALEERVIAAKYLVLAEGARGVWASRLGIPTSRRVTERFGFSALYAGVYSQPAVSIIVEPQYEIYVTPVGEDRISVACLGSRGSIRQLLNDNSQSVVHAALHRALGSHYELQGAPIGVGELGAVRRVSSEGGIFIVGDCCESFDPIGGMGMTHAILSGISCGRAIIRVTAGRASLPEAGSAYERERELVARPLRGLTRLVAFSLHQGYSLQLLQVLNWLGLDQAAHDLVLRGDNNVGVRHILSRMAIYAAGSSGHTKIAA